MSSDPSSPPVAHSPSSVGHRRAASQDVSPGTAASPASSTTSKKSARDALKAEAKRKTSRTLTPAQLAKKRANDREAQRAIRERTKSQIDALEKRIKELESDAPYRQTEAAIQEKEAIQKENEELRRKLSCILEIVQGCGITAGAREHKLEICSPTLSTAAPATIGPLSSSTLHTPRSLTSNINNPADQFVSRQSIASAIASTASSPAYIVSPTTPGDMQPPAFSQVPKNIPPTCLHDKILADFISEIRQHVAHGASVVDLLGPPYPDFTPLVNPDKRDLKNPLSLSALLIDLLKAFTHIRAIPEKVAVISNLFDGLRWLISPTYETYNMMPEYLRPVHTQNQVHHPMWIDFLPWPRMRFKMVHNYPSLSLDDFFIPYTMSLSVNWRYGDDPSSCLYHDSESDTIRMTPRFRAHVCNLDNWCVGPLFAEQIPLLADTCRIEKVPRTTS